MEFVQHNPCVEHVAAAGGGACNTSDIFPARKLMTASHHPLKNNRRISSVWIQRSLQLKRQEGKENDFILKVLGGSQSSFELLLPFNGHPNKSPTSRVHSDL